MGKIEKFEDLLVWQKARELCKLIFKYTKYDNFSKEFRLVDQIKASSGSAMDNIAEGFERGGNKEFGQFLWISKGSAAEVKSQLYRASDRKYINKEEFDEAYNLAEEIGKMIGGLQRNLKESDMKGRKYK